MIVLDDLCLNIVDCLHKTAPINELGNYFAVGTPAMRGNSIDYSLARRIDDITFDEWTKRLRPRYGDLLLAREAPVGPVVRIPIEENVAPGQRTVLLRPDTAKVISDYLYYLLIAPEQQERLNQPIGGSTVAHLNVADVRSFRLPDVPSLMEQRRIAGMLGALDDKIESNCAQQRIGEQLLRAVIEGILGQFSEADFISFDAYCTQSKESVRPENIGNGDKYIALEHMPRGSVFLNSWETAKLAGIASNKTRFRHGDLLFGKLRPYFKKVGVAPVSGVCSTDILVIRPRLPEFLPFIAVIASSDALIDSISASATGTRMPRASWKEIATWPVPQIPDETLTVLLHPANQLMAFLETLSLQNLKLAQLRDALLPELMSGRMRVDEAERLVTEALDEEVADV